MSSASEFRQTLLGGGRQDVRVFPGKYCVEHGVLGLLDRGLCELDSVVCVGLGPLGIALCHVGVPARRQSSGDGPVVCFA